MEARCPRCSTVFTTDRSGIQFCPNCGQQVDVPEPYARPPAPEPWGQAPAGGAGGAGGGGFGAGRFTGEPPPGGGSIPGQRELTPWERRKELGLFQGFFETWKRSVFSPQAFFPSIRPDVPWSEALFYSWIIHALTVAVAVPFVALGTLSSGLPRGFGGDAQVESAMRAMSGGVGVGWLIGTLVIYPLLVLAFAAIVHLVAMLFGAAQNGYGATVRGLCYATGPNLIGILPCVGCFSWIYGIVLSIFGIASLQQTTMGKAAGIVLLPIGVVVCCCGALYSVALASIMGLVGAATGGSRSL